MKPYLPKDGAPSTEFPKIEWEEEVPVTRPQPLHETPPPARVAAQLELVRKLHPRIALTIESLWGFPECVKYINSLVMSSDDRGVHREGFRPEVLTALMNLMAMHDK